MVTFPAEALTFTVKDIETAERMVEQSGGTFHVVSTRNLDHYRDQFADALYSSDRHEGAAGLMESSLDDAGPDGQNPWLTSESLLS